MRITFLPFHRYGRALRTLLLAGGCLLGYGHASGQSGIAGYKLAVTSEAYTPITGGTVFIAANVAYDNEISGPVSIPPFTFGGASISKVYLHANGYLSFDTALAATNYTPLATATTGNKGVFSAFGANLGFSGSNATAGAVSEIKYQQLGNEFVAQFTDMKRLNVAGERVTFQIRINSATGAVKIVYGGPVVIGQSSSGLQVGIRGNTVTWADNVNNIMVGDVPSGTACSWQNAVTGSANTGSCLTGLPNVVPVSGMALTWTPATTLLPVRTFSAAANITAASARISWTAPAGATQYNVQYRMPGSCNWIDYSGNPVTGTTVTLSGLSPLTTYQVRVQSKNGADTSIWSHIPNAAGSGSGYTATGTFTTLCSTPAPGVTSASLTSGLCSGALVSFSVANPNPGTGVTYQWQSSNDNVTYVNIAGATSAGYTGPANARYYRNQVRCATGPDSVVSVPVQLSYNNTITGVTPSSRCGIGTANLAATGSAGTTVKWYNAAIGGTSLATGNTFTTPVIGNTTTYYASAETNGAGTAVTGAGAGTTANADGIFYHSWGGCKSQFLVRASELQAAGLQAGSITSMAINMSPISATAVSYGNFAIGIGTTTNTDMSGGIFTGTLNTVYTNAAFTPVTDLNTFPLSTAFNWDGVSNIVVSFCWSNNNTGGTSNYAKVDNTGFISCAYYRADNQAATVICGGTTASNTTSMRPQFSFNGQAACVSVRVPVTATVTPPPALQVTPNRTICNNALTPLSVTTPAANYSNYTWSPAANLFSDSAGTVPYTGSNAATVYLKTAVTGSYPFTITALDSSTQCGKVARDTIAVLPGTFTVTASPKAICTSGTALLNLSPATGYAAGQIQWQSSASGSAYTDVNPGGNGITYTTPVLTTATYYRTVIKNSNGATCSTVTPDTVKVYNPAVTATAPAARCGPGVLTLGATVVDGTPYWYATATGTAVLGTGASFTTPFLTGNTTYYVSAGTAAATYDTFGTGTTLTSNTAYPTAFGNRWYQDWSQMVYTAAELHAAGLNAGYITSATFKIAALGSAATVSNYTISLGNTANTTMTGFVTTGITPVFGPATYNSAAGLNKITFTTPYYWDGISNLILDIRGTGANLSFNATTYYTATTANTVATAYSSSNNTSYYTSGPTAALGTSRLNVIFGSTGCESPRVPVVATVNTVPAAAITTPGPITLCEGTTATLSASGGGLYQWLNASGVLAGETNAAFNTTTPGVYKVAVKDAVTGCRDTSAAVTVNTHPVPAVQLGNDTTFCSGNTLVLDAGNAGSTFLWNDFSTAPTKTVTATGSYFVKVTNGFGCTGFDTIAVVVNPSPVASLGSDRLACTGTSVMLDAGNAGAAFLWNDGVSTRTRTVSSTGSYSVKVTNGYNCTVSDTVQVTFLSTPVVDLGHDTTFCASQPLVLHAGNLTGVTYLWDNGSTQPLRSVNTSGTYFVTVSNAADCKGSDTVQVTINPNPVVDLGNDTVICHGTSLILDARHPGYTYLWDNGATTRTREVNTAGVYHVTVADGYGCKGTDYITLSLTGLPSAAINAVHGDTATYTFNLLNPQHVTDYTWDFGDGSPLATGTYVQHRYAANGLYLVSVLIHGVCNDSAVVARTVEVYELHGATGIAGADAAKELKLYPSPARDFVVLETGNLSMQQVSVYNVLGQQVYDLKLHRAMRHQVDVSRLVSGIYTIRIETEAGVLIRKFEILK